MEKTKENSKRSQLKLRKVENREIEKSKHGKIEKLKHPEIES